MLKVLIEKDAIDSLATTIKNKANIINKISLNDLNNAAKTLGNGNEISLQQKTVNPIPTVQTVKPDAGYDGLSQVTVNAITTTTLATPSISIDSNGKITAVVNQTEGYVLEGQKIATQQLTTQNAKTIVPTTSSQVAVANNVYTTGVINVAAIPNNYVLTEDATALNTDLLKGKTAYVNGVKITGNIETKTSDNLTVNGATVSVPAGYYSNTVTKSVASAAQAVPSITVSNTGLIVASASQTAGYVSSGTKSDTKQLNTQGETTIIPNTFDQTAIANNVYTTGNIIVKGDENFIEANIAEGVTIWGKTGTHSGGGTSENYYSGTAIPEASLGNDGDLYLRMVE